MQDCDNILSPDEISNQDDNKDHSRRSFSRGVRTSFGFKRPVTAIPISLDTSNNKHQVHPVDNNGNDDSLDSLDSTDLHVSGRTTPRLAPPKKEANATRINRFGFRNQSITNKQRPATTILTNSEYKNNNVEKDKPRKTVSIASVLPKNKPAVTNNNKTAMNSKTKLTKTVVQSNLPTKYTFHTTQLPRPQLPVRMVESKNAKTAANINRKVSSASQRSDEVAFSSKEGSVTEDSGIGSHTSGNTTNFIGDCDTLHGIELMDSSPTFGARRNKPNLSRNIDFDVRDLDDSVEDGVVTEVAVIPLPRLPSVFANNSSDTRSTSSSVFGNVSTGMVRERTREFERQIDLNRRKISITSSEGFSEDYGEEEKSFRDRSSNEKSGQGASRIFSSARSFKESHNRKSLHSDKDSSPASSDDQDWELGGEAMAEVYSINFSSSDESKDKEILPLLLRNSHPNRTNHTEQMSNSCTGAIPKDSRSLGLLNRDELNRTGDISRHSTSKNIPSEKSYHMTSSCNSALSKDNLRSVLLTIEEPKYTSLSQICPPRPLNSTMMTSFSSTSSSTSSGIKDYLKSSLLTNDTKKQIEPSSMTNSTLTNSGSFTSPKDNLKSVLLSIEDPKFAAVAASSSVNLLDDETSPVDSLISSYTESEEIISKNKPKKTGSTDSKDVNEKSPLSPESPGTPTNASLSLSEGRDFLIDDEIADQPALMFNDPINLNSVDLLRSETHNNSSLFSDISLEQQNVSDSITTLVESTPKLSRKGFKSCDGSPALARAKNPLLSRTGSVDTLSPCESIASDDLMLDFEHSQSSGIEDSTDRLHLNEGSALHSLDEETIRSELENQDAVIARQWSSLLGTHSNKDSPPYSVVRTNNFLRSRTTTPNSVPDSPRAGLRSSLANSHSPLLRSARTTHGSPAAYDSDDSLRLDRVSDGSMVNDIVGIKTMLFKLKRVLQETDEDNMMRTEPLNPFDNQNSLKNGLCNGLSNEQPSDLDSMDSLDLTSGNMDMSELRRQIEFLQSQLEDRDRTVHQLQNQISKYNLDKHQRECGERDFETSNAATQTDRVRPLSAGPSLLQTLPSEGGIGPLVSVNECTRRSRPHSMVEPRTPPLKLWRKPGEPPPPPARFQHTPPSSLPRRARSRSRPTPTTC